MTEFSDGIEPENTNSLVAYRLGRLERLVETNNNGAEDRDKSIIEKLDEFSRLLNKSFTATDVLKVKVSNTEKSISNLWKVLGAVALVVLGILAEIITRAVQ